MYNSVRMWQRKDDQKAPNILTLCQKDVCFQQNHTNVCLVFHILLYHPILTTSHGLTTVQSLAHPVVTIQV